MLTHPRYATEGHEDIRPCDQMTKHVGHLLTVYIRVKVQVDLQADRSPVVVKGPFFPRVVNPRYRIRGTNV
jgi:hypothetical protein